MRLLISADKKLRFAPAEGDERWKNRQSEKLIVEIRDENNALVTVDADTLVVSLKSSKDAAGVLASCSTFDVSGGIYTGYINLNTDGANALNNAQVLLEVGWEIDGNVMCSDDAYIYIMSRAIQGDEGEPTLTTNIDIAQWLYAHVLAGTGVTIVKNETNGTITINT